MGYLSHSGKKSLRAFTKALAMALCSSGNSLSRASVMPISTIGDASCVTQRGMARDGYKGSDQKNSPRLFSTTLADRN
jgi:hypothetical protein